MKDSAQSFTRRKGPRVHIQYDVFTGGAEKKVEIPFVMGVLADLAGDNVEGQPNLHKRSFSEVDANKLDGYMKKVSPKLTFTVPNVLTDEGGEIAVDINFDSMKDFSPEAVARKVDALNQLLQARTSLDEFVTRIAGKPDAEKLVQQALTDPSFLEKLIPTQGDQSS